MDKRKAEYDRKWREANRDWQKEYDRRLTPEQKEAHREAKNARKRKFVAEFVGPRRPNTGGKQLRGPENPNWKSEEEKRATKNAARRRQYQKHKAKARAKDAKREADKAQRTPRWFGELDRLACEEAYALLPARKAATGVDWHVDHMLPLRGAEVSGLHVGANLAVIPARLNLLKGDKALLTETGDWLRV
jgi:hypothetical protein